MRERGVNNDSLAQPDPAIRAINMEPTTPGERQEVICMKVGTKYPNEMYIIGGHMDGIGWGQAVNDDASGSAIVMELARIFSQPDVQTERSIRFALWNNEETGLNGAKAYAEQRAPMQGKESPAGSGKYPEPKWLGMIQHDMMMVDHGPPTADGKLAPEQRAEADINIEFAITSKFADDAMKMAFYWRAANQKYATHYPAAVGPHMTNTDSDPFKDLVPSLSLRENERGSQIGGNWDPTHHQPTDVLTTFTDKDFMLGLTSAQWMLRHLVDPAAKQSQPWPYQQPAWVFSSRELPRCPGADIRFVRGDVRPVHERHGRGGRAARMSGSSVAVIWPASSTTTGCSTKSSCRSPRSRSARENRSYRERSRTHPCGSCQ